jgi:murein DD-endopeptidase MepM/ murein hydrolase activator NlpD
LLSVLARPRRTNVRRTSRALIITAVAIVPVVGFAAVAGAGDPVLKTLEIGSSRTTPMAYDRPSVAALKQIEVENHRVKVLGWYRVAAQLDASRRRADQQRASRGEPRQALPGAATTGAYWRPTTGTLTQPFHPGHDGIDIGVPIGTPVVAAADGVVSFAGEQSGYGTHVEVRHPDGTVTTYSHLSKIDVAVNERVVAGERIADSGNTGHSTGPHLHFEVHPTEGTKTDPLAWLRAHGAW